MKTFKIHTLGCKVNQYETQAIRERFLNHGFQEVLAGKKADNYIINTCTVTANADKQSLALIRNCNRNNPEAKIIVTGCLAEKDLDPLSALKEVDFIISKKFFTAGVSGFFGHTRAFLKIQDGCNNFCSYCKVPLVRGVSISRPLEEIVQEARQLVKNGFREIVITGICLGSFGLDLSPKITLAGAIKAIEDIEGLSRIRLSSIEPNDVSAQLIERIFESDKICRHLHIPLQSGDDEILRRMHRHYSRLDYLKLIESLKKRMPDIAISTDVLVGFPGENEIHFKNTLGIVRKILPLKVHIFPYSERKGTFAAESFKQNISAQVIKERIAMLSGLSEACAHTYKRQFLNKYMKVLIEGCSKKKSGYWQGYTANYIKVLVASKSNLEKQFISLKLKKIVKGDIIAELG